MKKLIAIAFALTASAASAETWNCICTQQDDFGSCVAWQCTKGDYAGNAPTAISDKQLLEEILSKDDSKVQELSISTK